MSSILTKVFPARQALAAQGAEVQRKVDQGLLLPAKANVALAELLCREMTGSLGEAAPRSFSVWLKGRVPGEAVLAGWSAAGAALAPRRRLAGAALDRVMGTRRPLLLNDAGTAGRLAAEILEAKGEACWTAAAVVPLEKAGEALGLTLAFFDRPLGEPDLEGLIRITDLLGSLLLTGERGLPETP